MFSRPCIEEFWQKRGLLSERPADVSWEMDRTVNTMPLENSTTITGLDETAVTQGILPSISLDCKTTVKIQIVNRQLLWYTQLYTCPCQEASWPPYLCFPGIYLDQNGNQPVRPTSVNGGLTSCGATQSNCLINVLTKVLQGGGL